MQENLLALEVACKGFTGGSDLTCHIVALWRTKLHYSVVLLFYIMA